MCVCSLKKGFSLLWTWPSLMQQDAKGNLWSHFLSIILGQRSRSWQREQMFPSVNKSFISALFDLCSCRDFKLSFPRSNRATTSAFFAFPPPSSRKPRLFIIHSFTWNHTTPLHLLFPSPPVKALRAWHIGSAHMFDLGENISSRPEIAQWKPNSRSDSKRLLAGWTCKTFNSFSSRLKEMESAKDPWSEKSLPWRWAYGFTSAVVGFLNAGNLINM